MPDSLTYLLVGASVLGALVVLTWAACSRRPAGDDPCPHQWMEFRGGHRCRWCRARRPGREHD